MPSVTYINKEVEDREAAAFENGMQTALKDIEAAKTNIQQLKAEIAALKQVTPLCPDLCKEYNQAIDDVLNLRQLSGVEHTLYKIRAALKLDARAKTGKTNANIHGHLWR